MWLGDQMQAFNRFDGLQSIIPAVASFGLSGFSFTHSDIGGYLGFSEVGVISVYRTKELTFRWMELSAFMDAMFRSHEGNTPALSWQITSDNSTMQQFARFAKVFAALQPYRNQLINNATEYGHPIARHPFLHYPEDRNLDSITGQIMLGSDLMICPVMISGAGTVRCYLPANSGTWTHFFFPTYSVSSGSEGYTFECPAPIGSPCALFRESSTYIPQVIANLQSSGLSFNLFTAV
jgi:alpha-glucosidase